MIRPTIAVFVKDYCEPKALKTNHLKPEIGQDTFKLVSHWSALSFAFRKMTGVII